MKRSSTSSGKKIVGAGTVSKITKGSGPSMSARTKMASPGFKAKTQRATFPKKGASKLVTPGFKK